MTQRVFKTTPAENKNLRKLLADAKVVKKALSGTVEETIKNRQSRHGSFSEVARVAQRLKAAMADTTNWITQGDRKCEALEQIATKIARVLCGDHDDLDHWHDIEGYAHLISDYLKEQR